MKGLNGFNDDWIFDIINRRERQNDEQTELDDYRFSKQQIMNINGGVFP